jgi:acetyl/propionyl-CoA carboxylase alpha subunit
MKVKFRQGNVPMEAELNREGEEFNLNLLEKTLRGKITRWTPPFFSFRIEEIEISGALYRGKNFTDIHLPEGTFRLKYEESDREGRATHAPGELTSPMPGKILKVFVGPGDRVKAGDTLMILEAMKMEHKIQSPIAGTVQKILFREGERVAQDIELVKIES